MNKKAQAGLGEILLVFIIVLVGVIVFTTSAQLIGDTTNTITIANDTVSITNMTNTSIQGKNWADLVVYNATNDLLILAGNYTLYNNQVINGAETARLEKHVVNNSDINFDWLISGTVQPTTYIASGGGRAIANLIVLFFAIAIAFVALAPTLRSKVLEGFGR